MDIKVLWGENFNSEFNWDTGNQSSVIGITTSCGKFHFESTVRSQTGYFNTVPTSIYTEVTGSNV